MQQETGKESGLPHPQMWPLKDAVEASHHVLIRFQSKGMYLERLDYQLSIDLGLVQANLTYMHAKLGTSYHWLPELYRCLKLPVVECIVEGL